jgi:hypothetical protein
MGTARACVTALLPEFECGAGRDGRPTAARGRCADAVSHRGMRTAFIALTPLAPYRRSGEAVCRNLFLLRSKNQSPRIYSHCIFMWLAPRISGPR